MAFVAIIALISGIIGGVAGGWFGLKHQTLLVSILGYLLAPLAWVMGVDWSDANLAGSLIGQKLAINGICRLSQFLTLSANSWHSRCKNRGDYFLRVVRFR